MLCDVGHFDCLTYVVEHGCPLDDALLGIAKAKVHLPSNALVVRHGLPKSRPYQHRADGQLSGSAQLHCLRHISGSGCPIHPGTLIGSASQGCVDTVCILHEGGMPLYEHAWAWELEAGSNALYSLAASNCSCMQSSTSYFRSLKCLCPPMRKVLRYGAWVGAPVFHIIQEMLRADRAGSRAVLLCIHVAARLSLGKGFDSGKGGLCPIMAEASTRAPVIGQHNRRVRGRASCTTIGEVGSRELPRLSWRACNLA
jgi:hypothetical protein